MNRVLFFTCILSVFLLPLLSCTAGNPDQTGDSNPPGISNESAQDAGGVDSDQTRAITPDIPGETSNELEYSTELPDTWPAYLPVLDQLRKTKVIEYDGIRGEHSVQVEMDGHIDAAVVKTFYENLPDWHSLGGAAVPPGNESMMVVLERDSESASVMIEKMDDGIKVTIVWTVFSPR